MIKKHSIIYLFGRGVPGLINFFAISIYTRLIPPDEYGKYALVFTTVVLFNMVCYQWIRLSLLRFLTIYKKENRETVLYGCLGISYGLCCVLCLLIALIYFQFNSNESGLFKLICFGLVLLWFEALFELSLEYYRSNLEANKYSFAYFLKSVVSIVVGCVLAYFKFGALALIIGLIASDVIVLVLLFNNLLKQLVFNINKFDKDVFITLLKYGLPFTASLAMTYIVNFSDRYFIKYFLNEASTGRYAVGYDMTKQSLMIIMQSINLACYPIVVRTFEREGVEPAREQAKDNFLLLLIISVPVTFGLMALSDNLSYILVGKQYASQVASIMPLIALATLISGVKIYYFDLSFQIGKKSYLQIWSVVVAAAVNIGLNIIWIPRYGVMGAVYSTVICYIIAVIISAAMGSASSFKLPFPLFKVLRIIFASVVMAVVLYILKGYLHGIFGLIILFIIGVLSYFFMVLGLKLLDFKDVKKIFQRKGATAKG